MAEGGAGVSGGVGQMLVWLLKVAAVERKEAFVCAEVLIRAGYTEVSEVEDIDIDVRLRMLRSTAPGRAAVVRRVACGVWRVPPSPGAALVQGAAPVISCP